MTQYDTNTDSMNTYDITKYYTRQKQDSHGANYIITPRDTCPLDVLNDRSRFVVISFDRNDDYVIVADRRYYLNKHNSIKATDKVQCRVAVVDLDALQHQKSYKYDSKFAHEFTAQFDSFDQLRDLARAQFAQAGTPFLYQIADYDADSKSCSYRYETSFRMSARTGATA